MSMVRRRANVWNVAPMVAGAANLYRNVHRYGPIVRAAGRMASRAFRGGKKGKQVMSASGITNQYDKKTIYRKRSMPRFRKRRWRRFVRKTNAVIRKDLASQSLVRSTVATVTIAAGSATTQSTAGATLYGFNGFAGDCDDLKQLAAAASGSDYTKIMLASAVLDCTFNNNGSTNLEIDIYYVVCRKDVPFARYQSINDCYQASFPHQAVLPGAGVTALTFQTRGSTPFQNSLFCSYFRILRKTKYFLSAGQSGTYQIRDPKDRVFDVELENNMSCRRGWTKGLLFIFKSTPENTLSGSSLVIGTTRTYNYRIMQRETVAAGLL